ncbi:MAG TPA: PepSY-associated TM helix domain-containing protein [Opitutaceae bacterium]|nr:PepSY-associated TM helix domain-containing protein [Opitutaceae bacterium]
MSPSLRKPLLVLHTWGGIISGLVLLTVALSGTVLIFRTQLERRMDPRRFIVPAGAQRWSIDRLAARARAAHPAGDLLSVRYYGDPTMPLLVLFSTREYVHLNPYTGEVLGTRARYGEGFGWVEGLHKYLTLDPDTGTNVNGTFGFVFAGLFLTGLVLWWPATRRALKAGLTVNRKLRGRPWHLNLHKTLGFYATAILLFSAVTGIFIAFDSTRAALDVITLSPARNIPGPIAGAGEQFAGFDAVARQIDRLMPHARETYIARPKQGLVTSYAIAADAPHPNARSYVWLDGATAGVVRFTPYARASRGYRLYYWLLSLHTAAAGGWVMKLLLLFGTLSVPVLAYTGVMSYLRRKSRQTATAPARPGAAGTNSMASPTPAK